jgi:hypothetical protein
MSIMQGDLAEYALPDLLMFLQGMRKHGQLIVENSITRVSAGVFFDRGEVVHAYCPPREGVQAINHLLRWEEGRFAFLKGATHRERTIEIDLHNLLLDGLRQLDEQRLIEGRLPAANTVLYVQRDCSATEDVRLTQVEWRVLSLINGRRTLQEVIDLSGLVELDSQRLVYGLMSSGLILTNHDDSYLSQIIPERVPTADAAHTRSSPPTMLANVLVKQIDGLRDLRQIRHALGCSETELVEEFNLLKRTGWVRIRSGVEVFERFLR